MQVFSRFKLRTKALIAPVLFLLAGTGLTVSAVQSYSVQMMEQRKGTLISVFEAVKAAVAYFADEEAAGRMTHEAAMRAARDSVSQVRYGKHDYVVILGPDATILVFPDARLIDKPNQDIPAKLGATVRAQVERTLSQGAFFNVIRVNRPGETAVVPKLSYNAPVGRWNWVGGAGMYIDDIEADVWRYGEQLSAITLVSVIVASLISWIAMAEFNKALRRVMGSMRQLADGETKVKISDRARRDEVGTVAETLETLRASLASAEQLRVEAAAAQDAIEIAKRVAEAERAERLAVQESVVTSLAEAMSRLAQGDLTCLIEEEFTVDYERLRNDFNAAVDALRVAMSSVIVNTSAIRHGTGEISHAADDLSRRTEQQAACLEETAAALDEITATVRKTAQGSVSAQAVVKAAESETVQGENIVRDAVSAMAEVESSSQKITAIIGVMDEIAFQTNLLALNAGVEAARAGDSGRGFAVVASEVRALAQRSAAAAKEIKELIGSSTAHVGRGVTLVHQSGAALGRIRTQVLQINGVVADIAASTREQATALEEVNVAINQMDQVTQQNAADGRAIHRGHPHRRQRHRRTRGADRAVQRGAGLAAGRRCQEVI